MKLSKFKAANLKYRFDNIEESIDLYKDAIKAHPQLYVYYENLARALECIEDVGEALKYYHLALSIKSDSVASIRAINRLNDPSSGSVKNAIYTEVIDLQIKSSRGSAMKMPEEVACIRNSMTSDINMLKIEYKENGLDRVPNSFVLYRIIGNDLYPRHEIGQSRKNLKFILDNEKVLNNCEKRWVVNRIVNREEEENIISLLEKHNQPYVHIPFLLHEYNQCGWDFDSLPFPDYLSSTEFKKLTNEKKILANLAIYRLKNNYIMNNNGARNVALEDGRSRAKWILPWDGNCFVTEQAWNAITSDVSDKSYLKYFAVPMERVLDNKHLLRADHLPNPTEEPQLLFRCDSKETFNPEFPYGRRPKVELFWRLGIPGKWDAWGDDPWDPSRRPLSIEANQFGCAGWVSRMTSGHSEQEGSDAAHRKKRFLARQDAIISMIDNVDKALKIENINYLYPFNLREASTKKLVVYAIRSDGLGERLNAIYNAMLISELIGCTFQFNWGPLNNHRHVAAYHAIGSVFDVFSSDFINRHYNPDISTECMQYLTIPKGNLHDVCEQLVQQISGGKCLAPQNPSLINSIKLPKSTRLDLSQRIWSKFEFAKPIENIKKLIFSDINLPKNAVAIHIRAGDIVYGVYSRNPTWASKIITAPMATVLACELQRQGKAIILFGQEQETVTKLADIYGFHTAKEFYKSTINSDLEFALSDVFLMSRCEAIYAGSSGFSRLANKFSHSELCSPFSIFSHKDWPELIHAEISNNLGLYSNEQCAYAYFVSTKFCIKIGAFIDALNYIRLARVFNPENMMYLIIESFVCLHMGDFETSNKLLSNFFEGCDFLSPVGFSRSAQLFILKSGDGGTPNRFSFERFIPEFRTEIDGKSLPFLKATLDFLRRKLDAQSVESFRLELLSIGGSCL